MLFHTFSSQEERRKWGGSDFLELQFCKLPPSTSVQAITAVGSITPWAGDSLYVSGDDTCAFLKEYRRVFGCGVYNNGRTGPIDPCGINYYGPGQVGAILARLCASRPAGCGPLAAWLNAAQKYNGFYILGV